MLNESSKRIVVIKNIPSEYIEEAILILKNEPDIPAKLGNGLYKQPVKKDEHILKEAKMIISNYIKENKLQVYERREQFKKLPKKAGRKNVFINIILVGSIALLAFLLARAF